MTTMLGDRLKSVRESRNLTQSALAETVGCRQSSINDIESGRNLTSIYLTRIARVLNVDSFWLETGEGEMLVPGSYEVPMSPYISHFEWNAISGMTSNDFSTNLEAIKQYSCPVPHSKRAFTTILEHERVGLQKGAVLYLDPETKYSNRDVVLVVYKDSRMVDLRMLVSDGARTFLRSLDPEVDPSFKSQECRISCTEGGELMVPESRDDALPDVVLIGRLIFVGLLFS